MTTVKQSQQLLHITYGIVPIVAGADKFTNLLTNWEHYLGDNIKSMLPVSDVLFMKGVGVIEIIAGILVFAKPIIGAYVVMAWLIAIALTLVAGGNYYDVAVRDLVMAIGALTLARLTIITKQTNR